MDKIDVILGILGGATIWWGIGLIPFGILAWRIGNRWQKHNDKIQKEYDKEMEKIDKGIYVDIETIPR